MEMIEKNIAELLYRYNCVIIPGFGAFVGNYNSAKIDTRRNLIEPPSKDVIFNKNIVRNDGLLISKIQEDQNCSYDAANEYISKFIDAIKDQLKANRRIELNTIGILFYDNENNIQFEQDRFSNLLLRSFGLQSVKFYTYDHKFIDYNQPKITTTPSKEVKPVVVPVQKITPKEDVQEEKKVAFAFELSTEETAPKEAEAKLVTTENEKAKKEVVSPINDKKKDKKVKQLTPKFLPSDKKSEASKTTVKKDKPLKTIHWGRIAVAAAMIPLAFYSYWIPFQTNVFHTGYITLGDFNPLNQTEEPRYKVRKESSDFIGNVLPDSNLFDELEKLPENVAYYSYQLDDNLYVPVDLKRKKASTPSAERESENANANETKATVTTSPAGSVHVVVGCFGDKSNANKLVKELKVAGFKSAHIVDKDKGLHRVSAGGFGTDKEARNQKDKLKTLGFKGWFLRK